MFCLEVAYGSVAGQQVACVSRDTRARTAHRKESQFFNFSAYFPFNMP
jgi:hypothetical protein